VARIDSLLAIVVGQGANELRLGVDREPKMFASGVSRRLSLPATPEPTLRELLGGLFDPHQERALASRQTVELTYDAPGHGRFAVKAVARDGGFDVVFLLAEAVAAPEPALALRPPASRGKGPPPATGDTALATGDAPGATRDAPATSQSAPATPSHGLAAGILPLVAAAFALRASDLHLSDGREPVVRVDGVLRALGTGPVDMASVLALSASEEGRVATGGSVDLGVDLDGVGRVRVHVFRTAEGRSATLRLLPGSAPSLGSLHMPIALDDLVELPHGLVLIGGASGSGKSTTLAALAQEALRRRSIVLTTLEDPIEYPLSAPGTALLRRRQIGTDVPDFASGLRDALREDPDVLLVGEMRDPETISLALTAAETGHLVLSSIHCRSAASAVERIVDASRGLREPQIRAQLAESLRAIVVQRLLPRANGRGLLPVVEVLRVTHAVASLIREGKSAQIATALQSGRREGMLALERCLADRVQAGEITSDAARSVANDPLSLAMYLAK
jgi:twitching motility protein PilT